MFHVTWVIISTIANLVKFHVYGYYIVTPYIYICILKNVNKVKICVPCPFKSRTIHRSVDRELSS